MQKTDDELIKRMIANQAKVKNVATPISKNNGTAFSGAYKNRLGYNTKTLPTYRPEKPAPTGLLDKYIFDPLNKITSGAMYPLAKRYAEMTRARDSGNLAKYTAGETAKTLLFGGPRYIKDFYKGATGDINYTGGSVVSQVFDDPKGIRSFTPPSVDRALDNKVVRGGLGLGLEIGLDPTTYIPLGAPLKAVGGVAGKGLKAVGATDNLINPAIKATKEFGPVRTVLKRFGKLTPELSKAEQAVNKVQRSMGAEISDSIYKFLQGNIDPKRIEDMKTYVKVLVNGTAKVADDAPEAAKLLAKGLPTGLTKQAAKQFIKVFDQEMDTAVKTIEKLGKNIDQELLQRHFMGAVDPTNFSKDYENIVKPFRRLEKEVVTEGLIKAGVITRETAERYPNYARKFYPVVEEQGTIEGLDLVAKGSQKIGPEMGLSKMAKGDELRAIEYMMGKSDAKEYTGVLNRYQKLLGGKMSLEEQNKAARKLRPQLEKLFGDQLPMVAYEQQITRDMVQNASITIAKTIEQGLNRVTTENFLNLTTKHFGKTAREVAAMGAEGKFYKQIPMSKRYGDLMGKYVPDSIYEDVVGILSVKNNWLSRATNAWKQVKLFSPLNFASVSRNQFGDMILMSVSESPMSITRQLADLPKAIKEYQNQGPVYKAMLERGVFAGSFAAQEGTRSLAKATGKLGERVMETRPIKGVKAVDSSPLFNQARKYKSAQEFVDSLPTAYHGTKAKLGGIQELKPGKGLGDKFTGKNLIYTSTNPEIAKGFGDNVLEGKISGKIFDTQTLGDIRDPNKIVIPKEFSDYKTSPLLEPKDKRVFEQTYLRGHVGNYIVDMRPNINEYLKKKGYTAVTIPRVGPDVNGLRTETIILDNNALHSKSQLADIWEQANKVDDVAQTENVWVTKDTLRNKTAGALDTFTDVNIKTRFPGIGAGKEMYSYTSDINKINMVKYQMSKGKSIDEAIRLANKATFDYSALPQGLTGFRDNFMPFMTFKYFALQLAWDTLINRTGKIAALPKVKRAVESLSEPQPGEEQGLPTYIKENRGLNVRLPWKNEKGDSRYLNLQYAYPFGDVLETKPLDVMLGNPFVRVPIELAMNKSLYFDNEIAQPLDPRSKQFAEYGKYAIEQLGPKPGLREFSKIGNAITGSSDRYGNRREIIPTALDVGLGIKTSTPDIELGQKFSYYDKKEELSKIESKIRSVMRDQSLSERQKDKELARLRELHKKTYLKN